MARLSIYRYYNTPREDYEFLPVIHVDGYGVYFILTSYYSKKQQFNKVRFLSALHHLR